MSSYTTTNSPNFIALDEAAAMTEGTITFIPGVQALFAEALKNICFVKGIPVIRRCIRLWALTKRPVRTARLGCMS